MFTPLQPRHIRLVCILPSDCPNSPLECTLVHSPLDATPPYEALSYAWGSGTVPGRPIMLDGLGLNITAELEEALRRLRPLDSSRTMWIDAICINQADLAERNAQVVLMSDIYRRADRVIAWLGEETPDSKRAITYIEEMAAWVTMANGGDASSESENEARAAILSTPKNRKDAQSRRREADRKKKEYIALCKEHLTCMFDMTLEITLTYPSGAVPIPKGKHAPSWTHRSWNTSTLLRSFRWTFLLVLHR